MAGPPVTRLQRVQVEVGDRRGAEQRRFHLEDAALGEEGADGPENLGTSSEYLHVSGRPPVGHQGAIMARIGNLRNVSFGTLQSMLRKGLVLAIAVAQIGVFGTLIVREVVRWNEIGWAGMAYQIDTGVDAEVRRAPSFWGADSRRVEMVVPAGPADRVGIEPGDRIVAVNGIEVGRLDELEELAESSVVGDELEYVVETDAGRRAVNVELGSPYRLPVMVATTATSVVVGVVFLLISVLVVWGRARSRVALVFFLMCVFGAAEYLVWGVYELQFPNLRGITPATVELSAFFGLGLVLIFAVVLVNLLLHLALLFPRTRPVVESWPRVFVWLHAAPFASIPVALGIAVVVIAGKTATGAVIAAVVAALGLAIDLVWLRRRAVDGGWWMTVRRHPWPVLVLPVLAAGPAGFVIRLLPREIGSITLGVLFAASILAFFGFILAYSVIIVVVLIRSYRESGVDERRQVRWPLWGTLTAVGCSVVVVVVQLVMSLFFGTGGHVDFTTNVVLGSANKLFYVLIPISFAFGIVKYRLMEIDVIIKKTVVYSGVTGFILVVYLLLAGISGLALVRSAGVESQTATVVATLAVVALFVPVRNRIQRLVDRIFFRREQTTQASMRRVTETTSQASSVDTMATDVAEEVQRALHCRTVAVLTRSSDAEAMSAAATVGLPDRAAPRITLDAADPVLSGDTIHIDSAAVPRSPEVEQLFAETRGERAVLCRRGDETVALLVVGRKLDKGPFDDEDEVFLEAVAGQLAVGLGRLRGRRAELEFGQALEIQRSLLPAEIPQLPGVEVAARWQPAREVSGDYYDALRLADDRLALCIGDVVGKGMPAALLMSSLQAAVKAVATADADPAAICAQVRAVVTSNLSGGKFVTFFYAVIDSAARQLRFTNCGHNQPVLVRADGRVERLATGGPAFARLMRDDGYSSGELELRSGDRLVLFTDGVSEAADSAGDQFGEDRLVELVVGNRTATAGGLEAAIRQTILEHASGALQDDLTLVVAAVE